MADQHIDIERMIMQAHYKMQLETEASSVEGGQLSDMEREQYQNQIKDLLQAVETLLKSNKAMGERVTQLEKVAEAYDDLKTKYEKLEGELAMRKRGQHGKRSEKPKDTPDANPASDGSKDDDEDKYIENGSKNDAPADDEEQEDEKRECVFVNESKYDTPRLVPHTSATYSMLSDLGVNRFQYALSSGREMYRMFNEKMCMSKQSILNWLARGAELLEGGKEYIKKKLLKNDTSIYCDETWVWTKVLMSDGTFKYVKRYMWVIVNLTTKVCYYLFGRRKRKVIEEFLGAFKGTLMTDAYNAYAYFNKLDGCTHLCCWAHVRRIFWSALKDYKDELSQEFIDLIGILYKVELESILLHRTEAEVLDARKTESIPILNELDQRAMALLAKIKSKEVTVSSKLEHALNYMHNNWKELIAYIDVGSVLIDNNCCERAVRPFTNLRKSFGGFSSEKGGEVAAAWLTFIETCKLQKKAALDFFQEFFKKITEGRADYELIAQEILG